MHPFSVREVLASTFTLSTFISSNTYGPGKNNILAIDDAEKTPPTVDASAISQLIDPAVVAGS